MHDLAAGCSGVSLVQCLASLPKVASCTVMPTQNSEEDLPLLALHVSPLTVQVMYCLQGPAHVCAAALVRLLHHFPHHPCRGFARCLCPLAHTQASLSRPGAPLAACLPYYILISQTAAACDIVMRAGPDLLHLKPHFASTPSSPNAIGWYRTYICTWNVQACP